MSKATQILLNAFPIVAMIGLIPVIKNDYILTLAYAIIIFICFSTKKNPNDLLVFVFGFFIMIACEYLFVSTGVETFQRHSLLGFIPLWLPFLWGYGFVAIKRAIEILHL